MMNRRGLTIIELLILVFLVIFFLLICISIGSSSKSSSLNSGNVLTQVITIGPTLNEGSAIQKAMNEWVIDHPEYNIISVTKSENTIGIRQIVIVATKKENK